MAIKEIIITITNHGQPVGEIPEKAWKAVSVSGSDLLSLCAAENSYTIFCLES
jgi:hypothetical protein